MESEHQDNSTAVDGATTTPETKVKRLYDGLTSESKERVTFLVTRYRMLTTGDRDALLQELGLISTDNASAKGDYLTMSKVVSTIHPDESERVQRVRDRDPAFIRKNTDSDTASAAAHMSQADLNEDAGKVMRQIASMSSDAAVADSLHPATKHEMRQLLVPGLFGECRVSARLGGKPAECGQDTAGTEDCAGAATAATGHAVCGDCDTAVAASDARRNATKSCLLRSTAYQHFRLTHNLPAHLNGQARPAHAHSDEDDGKRMYNVTGVPLYESELRMWFDELDTDHTGTLDLDQFNQVMTALERDFGVDEEYNNLAKKGVQLSSQGRLSYEAFAYLIMRFARA